MKTISTRPMRPDDWQPSVIESGRHFNKTPLTGFSQSDGLAGSILHPADKREGFEAKLLKAHTAFEAAYPFVNISRYHIKMPFWRGQEVPTIQDYLLVDAPQGLTSTSITVVLVPVNQIESASMGFYFQNKELSSLRERLQKKYFQGLIGNLGYFMTRSLINKKYTWSHNTRYPNFPLSDMPSYIGFHWFKGASKQISAAFDGIHPAAVGIHKSGKIDILPKLKIDSYIVTLGTHKILIDSINNPDAIKQDVMLFTPALKTSEIQDAITTFEVSRGSDKGWQMDTSFIPIADNDNRVNVFIANEGKDGIPVEEVRAVWEGRAPLPSFGAVLSFKREYFSSLFESVKIFKRDYLNQNIQIIPKGDMDFDSYEQIMGGFVPAIIDGKHIYCVETVAEIMRNMSDYGNATSPIALAGKESKNFDPYIREPIGVLVQTEHHIGWILFDGRHELSIGANIVDVAILLKKLEAEGVLKGESIEQAIFVDGGSAMKTYAANSNETTVKLDLLNRVAAGSRNSAGADPDGLNLYSTLALNFGDF